MGRRSVVVYCISVMILAISMLPTAMPQSAQAQAYGPQPLSHHRVVVYARSYEYVRIRVNEGDTIQLSAYIYREYIQTYTCFLTAYRCPVLEADDIDVEIIGPDGRVVLPKQRFNRTLSYEVKAYASGEYLVRLDNTYSSSTKVVDVAIAVVPRPTTVQLTATSTVTTSATTTTTYTTTLEVMRWDVTAMLAIALLVVGLAVGYVAARKTAKH